MYRHPKAQQTPHLRCKGVQGYSIPSWQQAGQGQTSSHRPAHRRRAACAVHRSRAADLPGPGCRRHSCSTDRGHCFRYGCFCSTGCSTSIPQSLNCHVWAFGLCCRRIGQVPSDTAFTHHHTHLHLSVDWIAKSEVHLRRLQAVLSCTLQLASSRACYDHAPFCWSLTAQTLQMLWRQMASYCHAKASLHPMLSLCQCLPVLDDAFTVQSFPWGPCKPAMICDSSWIVAVCLRTSQ